MLVWLFEHDLMPPRPYVALIILSLHFVPGCLVADLHDAKQVESAISGPFGSKVSLRFARGHASETPNDKKLFSVSLTRGCWLPNIDGSLYMFCV